MYTIISNSSFSIFQCRLQHNFDIFYMFEFIILVSILKNLYIVENKTFFVSVFKKTVCLSIKKKVTMNILIETIKIRSLFSKY